MILLSIPSVPPSSNNAYFNLPGGGRALTSEAKKYLRETKAHLAQSYRKELLMLLPDVGYGVMVRFSFPEVTNKTWPKTAKTRYKKLDATNRIKLLEDALKDAAGTDDSQNLVVVLLKAEGPEHTDILIWNLKDEQPPNIGDFRLR